MKTRYYTWSAEVLVPGQGLMDARGANYCQGTATEAELKAAAARDVAEKHGKKAQDIRVFGFTYSEVGA